MNHLIKSIRVRDCYPIEDSGLIELGPLTVVVGANGSGKSSLIRALRIHRDERKESYPYRDPIQEGDVDIKWQDKAKQEAIQQCIERHKKLPKPPYGSHGELREELERVENLKGWQFDLDGEIHKRIRKEHPEIWAGIAEILSSVGPEDWIMPPHSRQIHRGPLSSGLVKLMDLLATLRQPEMPSLLALENIDQDLDPSNIHLIVDEIQRVVEGGETQILCTTVNPYFLDLIPLRFVVLVERVNGLCTFSKPIDNPRAVGWSQKFGTGELWTMGVFKE